MNISDPRIFQKFFLRLVNCAEFLIYTEISGGHRAQVVTCEFEGEPPLPWPTCVSRAAFSMNSASYPLDALLVRAIVKTYMSGPCFPIARGAAMLILQCSYLKLGHIALRDRALRSSRRAAI